MPFDDTGREYKECQYDHCAIKRMYRDEDPYKKLNTPNWRRLRFCCVQHKRDAHNPFRTTINKDAITTEAGKKRKRNGKRAINKQTD